MRSGLAFTGSRGRVVCSRSSELLLGSGPHPVTAAATGLSLVRLLKAGPSTTHNKHRESAENATSQA